MKIIHFLLISFLFLPASAGEGKQAEDIRPELSAVLRADLKAPPKYNQRHGAFLHGKIVKGLEKERVKAIPRYWTEPGEYEIHYLINILVSRNGSGAVALVDIWVGYKDSNNRLHDVYRAPQEHIRGSAVSIHILVGRFLAKSSQAVGLAVQNVEQMRLDAIEKRRELIWKDISLLAERKAMTPYGDRVLLKREIRGEVEENGIILPKTPHRDRHVYATVKAVGPGKRDKTGARIPMSVKVGDRVILPVQEGMLVSTDPTATFSELLEDVLVRDREILAVVG